MVDDDVTCLKILDQMLQKCKYRVTTCSQATVALSLLRERRDSFDVVISDVHMPDMNGFKLLELVGLEMDLPVIMMSADGGTQTVMRGIKHGACDYLIKPVRMEELKNIWQHVIRKKCSGHKNMEHSGSMDDSERSRRVADDTDAASLVNDGNDGSWKSRNKRKESKEDEDDGELDHEDHSSKKPRVVWSVELHQQFVSAVSQLGIEKAVPKRILELMNVPGLTRENVASHLQKFRLYLKRISVVPQHQKPLPTSVCGLLDSNAKPVSVGRIDFQTLAASGQIPAQTLAALHAEFLGHPSSLPAMDSPVLQASRQAPKHVPPEKEITFGQPIFKCQSTIANQFPATSVAIENISSTYSSWPSNNMMHSPLSEPNRAISVQPSCLIFPTKSTILNNGQNTNLPTNQNSMPVSSHLPSNFQLGNKTFALTPDYNFNNSNKVLDYSLPPLLPSNSLLNLSQASDIDLSNICVANESSGSVLSSVSPCSARAVRDSSWHGMQNQNININHHATISPTNLASFTCQDFTSKADKHFEQEQIRNLGFVGKGIYVPSRFAADDIESPVYDQGNRNTSHRVGNQVKQEFHLDFTNGAKAGGTVCPQYSSNNFTSVLSK